MPKRSSKPKPHKETQQLARSILDAVASDAVPKKPEKAKDPAAVALRRLGGAKGGATKLSATERKAIASKAAIQRWKNR